MKALTLILICLAVGWCSGYLIKVPTSFTSSDFDTVSTSSLGWVEKHKLMMPLFENVCDESTDVEVLRWAQEFTLDTSDEDYTKTGVIEKLRGIKNSVGLLPKGEIFTEFNKTHFDELRALYEVFYYAKDFNTFYKAACWARQNINCGLYIDAIYMAILTRKDTSKLTIPPPYELIPNYFIRKDIIIKASSILAGAEPTLSEDVRVENNAYVLDVNYTDEYSNDDDESKLAYFREDVGLNSFYFMWKIKNALRINPVDSNSIFGEYMYFTLKEDAARYDLERYSNNLPEVEGVNWDEDVVSYDPMLIYSNGVEFERRISSSVEDSTELNFLKTVENNLSTIVSHLRQSGHNKTQILNHIMDILKMSEKNYETIAIRHLANIKNTNERELSTLDHYITTVRDPVYWNLNKKIVQLVDNALKMLPSYSREELYFPGVEILNVEVKKMITYFDTFNIDVTDALKTASEQKAFSVKIAQPRLNHKPFSVKVNVSSLIAQKGIVKLYIGPRTNPGEFTFKKNLFLLLDRFDVNLKRGVNVVSRSSEDIKFFRNDYTSLKTLKKQIEDAELGLDALAITNIGDQIGYPMRLILPKGLPEGLPLQLFVFIAPLYKKNNSGSLRAASTEYNFATLSPGYPLDLDIDEKVLFGLPNALIKNILITHKDTTNTQNEPIKSEPRKQYEQNIENDNVFDTYDEPWCYRKDTSRGLSKERPVFTYVNKGKTDYAAKRNQYKNNQKYETPKINEVVTDKSDSYVKNDGSYIATEINIEDRDKDEYSDEDSAEQNTHKIHNLLGGSSKNIYKKLLHKYAPWKYSQKNEEKMFETYSQRPPSNTSRFTDEQKQITKKMDRNYIYVTEETSTYNSNRTPNITTGTPFVDANNSIAASKNTNKFIFINDDKILNKDVQNQYSKNVIVNKENEEKYESIIKKIIQTNTVPSTEVTNNADVDILIDNDIKVVELPKRRVTVYDYLFNNNEDDLLFEF